jgi:hypothetical protein
MERNMYFRLQSDLKHLQLSPFHRLLMHGIDENAPDNFLDDHCGSRWPVGLV